MVDALGTSQGITTSCGQQQYAKDEARSAGTAWAVERAWASNRTRSRRRGFETSCVATASRWRLCDMDSELVALGVMLGYEVGHVIRASRMHSFRWIRCCAAG